MRLLFAALLVFCLLPQAARADQHWLLVSDIHLDPFSRDPVPAYYRFDTNWPLFTSALDEMRRAEPRPRVVVITGDFLAHHWDDKARAAGVAPQTAAENTMKRIAAAFQARFPHAQFLIVLGNNDDPCGDYQSTPGTPYFRDVAKIWAPLVNRDGAAAHFEHEFGAIGAYTARLPLQSVQAVALDDVYWSIVYRNCGRAIGNPPREQIALLRSALQSREFAHTIVVFHIPPGIDPASTMLTHRFLVVPFLNDTWQTEALRTLAAYKDRIPVVFAGHTHRNAFRVFGGVPFLIAAAVSPIYRNDPGFLRLDVSGNGTVRDYRQYAYDEDSGTWNVQSDFREAFGANAFTAAQLGVVQARIARDPVTRERWTAMQMNEGRYREIDGGNWRIFWCAQTDPGKTYLACAGVQRRAELLPALAAVLAVAVLFGLTLLILRLTRHRRA